MNQPVFLDSKLVPSSHARLSAFNTAFLHGECLLEAIPVYNGRPLFLDDHLERLRKGCLFLGWPYPGRARFQRAIGLFAAHPQSPAHFIVRFGLVQELDPPVFPRQFSRKPPRLLAMIRPLRHRPEDLIPPSGRAGIGTSRVPGPSAVPGQFKWIFYMMVRRDFRLHPEWDEMLRLNEKGFVVDGGSSSPLWAVDGKVYSPPLREGGLESVTRRKILKICRSLRVPVVEKGWKPPDVLKKGELFFVGSGVGILTISHLMGKPLRRSTPLALRLWQHYRGMALGNASS